MSGEGKRPYKIIVVDDDGEPIELIERVLGYGMMTTDAEETRFSCRGKIFPYLYGKAWYERFCDMTSNHAEAVSDFVRGVIDGDNSGGKYLHRILGKKESEAKFPITLNTTNKLN